MGFKKPCLILALKKQQLLFGVPSVGGNLGIHLIHLCAQMLCLNGTVVPLCAWVSGCLISFIRHQGTSFFAPKGLWGDGVRINWGSLEALQQILSPVYEYKSTKWKKSFLFFQITCINVDSRSYIHIDYWIEWIKGKVLIYHKKTAVVIGGTSKEVNHRTLWLLILVYKCLLSLVWKLSLKTIP